MPPPAYGFPHDRRMELMNTFGRLLVLASLGLALLPCVCAQSTQGELIFAIKSAVKSHDDAALEDCFNFDGTDPGLATSIRRTIDQITTWSYPVVFTSERTTTGPLEITSNGKTMVLNGDWSFQVHIHRSPPPSKGYVFPAGRTASGAYRVLLTVEKKSPAR